MAFHQRVAMTATVLAVALIGGFLMWRQREARQQDERRERVRVEEASRQAARARRAAAAPKQAAGPRPSAGGRASESTGAKQPDKKPKRPRAAAQAGTAPPVPGSAEAVTLELDKLLDDEAYDKLVIEAKKLIKHPNPEVRSRVAFALHWAGLQGLAELTSMLGDPDPEVAQEALDYWKTALSDIENPADKAAMLDAAYTVTGDHTDGQVLEDLLSEFTFVDDELIAAAHLAEMAGQSKNPAHAEAFIEALDGISQPDETSKTVQEAIANVKKWERQERRERAEQEQE